MPTAERLPSWARWVADAKLARCGQSRRAIDTKESSINGAVREDEAPLAQSADIFTDPVLAGRSGQTVLDGMRGMLAAE